MLTGDKEGISVYVRLIHFTIWQKLTQHCKATKFQKKKLRGSVLHCLFTHTHEYCVRQVEGHCTSVIEMPLLYIFRTSTHLEH